MNKKSKIVPKQGFFKNNLYDLCLSAIFLSLCLISKLIFKNFKIINGSGLEIHFLIYALGLIFIKQKKYKFIFYLITPLTWLIFGFEANPVFDYLFASWSFWPFLIFANKLLYLKAVKKHQKLIFYLIFLSLMAYGQTLFWYTISGVLFYRTTWIGSIIFNWPIALFNFLINTILICLIFIKIYHAKNDAWEGINQLKWRLQESRNLNWKRLTLLKKE